MRVLLIAYEYPPVLAAQSLRWHYLGNHLGELGVELDVLTASLRDIWGFEPELHPGVRVHRCFPGPFVGLSGHLAKYVKARDGSAKEGEAPGTGGSGEIVYRLARRALDHLVFPDVRTEWLPFAWRAAQRLHSRRRYDLVISSHEPGVDLLLGLKAKRHWQIPWVADLADPLLTPYTPRWRARLDRLLEGRVCREANAVIVTHEVVADLLAGRHGIPSNSFTVVQQGFTSEANGADPPSAGIAGENGRMVLLFTGSFYRGFRDPSSLLEALSQFSDLHFVVAGEVGPFKPAFDVLEDRVRLLGKQSHARCLALQRKAGVLVNLGNTQSYQIPGKFYEYLGAGRPILHIAGSSDDPVSALVEELVRGYSVMNDPDEIVAALQKLRCLWRSGSLDGEFDLTADRLKEFSWEAGARRLHGLLERIIAGKV